LRGGGGGGGETAVGRSVGCRERSKSSVVVVVVVGMAAVACGVAPIKKALQIAQSLSLGLHCLSSQTRRNLVVAIFGR